MSDAVFSLEPDGRIAWSDERFQQLPVAAQDRVAQWCGAVATGDAQRTHVEAAGHRWEVLLKRGPDEQRFGLMVEITEAHEQQLRLEAIDRAGLLLLDFDRNTIADLSVADRLRLLEQRIVASVKQELKFDHFEIRLRAPGSDRLELVISENLSPMRIGETISASETGNGISGWVAATGQSYVCADVRKDPLYREGLDDARSSLTVPLVLRDRVIGVFNIESDTEGVFTSGDQVLAERFGGYIANVLHLLDLLVVERITTSEQVARNMSSELERPIADLQQIAASLRDHNEAIIAERIQKIVSDIANRVSTCAAGPRSIVDAEHELHAITPDAQLQGLTILVVDDEDRVRIEVSQVLERLGCDVTACGTGTAAFAAIEKCVQNHPFAMVVSDIRLPDASGYEVFTKSRETIPDVPVVLMTGFGYDPDHTIVRASADGVQGILLKPFRTSQLIEAVRNAVTSNVSN